MLFSASRPSYLIIITMLADTCISINPNSCCCLQFGTIKDRMLNILPLVVLLTYVIVSLETKDFKSSMVVYFIIPILSVLLKPKNTTLNT